MFSVCPGISLGQSNTGYGQTLSRWDLFKRKAWQPSWAILFPYLYREGKTTGDALRWEKKNRPIHGWYQFNMSYNRLWTFQPYHERDALFGHNSSPSSLNGFSFVSWCSLVLSVLTCKAFIGAVFLILCLEWTLRILPDRWLNLDNPNFCVFLEDK